MLEQTWTRPHRGGLWYGMVGTIPTIVMSDPMIPLLRLRVDVS